MYKSPIKFNYEDITMTCDPIRDAQEKLAKDAGEAFDNAVMSAIFQIGIHVDKDELVRALTRSQELYTQGYDDAVEQLESESGIIHCNSCTFYKKSGHCGLYCSEYGNPIPMQPYDFCSNGEKK